MVVKIDSSIVSKITENLDKKEYHSLDLYYGEDENSTIAKNVLKSKYLAPWEDSLFDMWVRLAWGAAQAEDEDNRIYWARQFFSILKDFKFIPGGRINYGLGRDDIKVSFSNCYVVPILEDSLDGIYKCLTEEAKTYKVGGGCGHDLSILRPKGDPIITTSGNSCGPIGFCNLFSVSTNTVQQQNRRGANMQSILVSHPDVEDFIEMKNDASWVQEAFKKITDTFPSTKKLIRSVNDNFVEKRRNVQHSNVSVKLTDEFMKAVESKSTFDLTWGGKVYKTVNAEDLWRKVTYNAWLAGEPGLMFWDRMVETNNLEYCNPIISSNPCSELPLGKYGNCLLGHMNLVSYVEEISDDIREFNFDEFVSGVKIAQRFLDNIITLNDGRHALPEQNEVALNERRTGMGITGLGDMLIMLGYRYGSSNAISFVKDIMRQFRDAAYDSSCELGVEKGSFPWFDASRFFDSKFSQRLPDYIKAKISSTGIRNGMLLTCAPVGSGSIIAQTSSGIEPMFRTSFLRKVKDENDNYTHYKVYHPLIKRLYLDSGVEFPDCVVDASDISPADRVDMQAAIQYFIDNSISSTVNLPRDATEEQVAEIYFRAWKSGCKGITVYREGSREGILLSNDEADGLSNEVDLELVGANEDNKKWFTLKRPNKLQGETYKIRTDTGSSRGPVNCYYTVNFFPNSDMPYELLITEPPGDKDMKDVLALELATRCTSMMLRHRVPLEFIISQFEKMNGQYIYSIPINIARVLRSYLNTTPSEGSKLLVEKCTKCGSEDVRFENGCNMCHSCGFSSKCS